MKKLEGINLFNDNLIFSVLILLSIILRGGWTPFSNAVLLFLSSVLLLKKHTGRARICVCSEGLFTAFACLYSFFGIAGGNGSFSSVSSVTGVLFSLNVILIIVFDRKSINSFFNGIFGGCFVLAVIGILGYGGVIPGGGTVLSDNGVLRIQSLIQYANCTALFMGIGYVVTVFLRISKNKPELCAIEILFLSVMFLTFSKIFFAVFGAVALIILLFFGESDLRFFTLFNIVLSAVLSGICVLLCRYGLRAASIPVLAAGMYVSNKIYASSLFKSLGRKYGLAAFFAIVGLYLAVIVLFSVLIFVSDSEIVKNFKSSMALRFVYIKDGLSALSENPLLGIGAGRWEYCQFKYQSAFYDVKYIHSFIQIAVDAGLIAFALFLSSVLFGILQGIKKAIKKGFADSAAACVIMLMIIMHSMFDVDLSFGSVMAILAGCIGICSDGKMKEIKLPMKGIESALAVFGAFLIVGFVVFNVGINENNKGNSALLEKAVYFRPKDSEIFYELAKKEKEPDKAKELLEIAGRINPEDYRVIQGKYILSYKSKAYDEAYSYAYDWINAQPLNSEAYEAVIFALKSSPGKYDIEKEKNKLFAEAKAANEKIIFASRYIKNCPDIPIGLLWSRDFDE